MTQLHRDSPIPLNYQLSQQLEAEIVESRWQVGARIPSVRQLTERFGVSMPVVRQALQHLANEGVIETLHGKGSFVRKRPEHRASVSAQTLVFMLTDATPMKMNYFLRVLPEVEKAAVANGLSVEFNQFNPDIVNATINQSRPRGVIWCGGGNTSYIEDMVRRQLPVVAVGDGPDIDKVTRIVNDDFEGGYIAGKHLFGLGHRHVTVIQRHASLTYARRRLAGFRHAAEEFTGTRVEVMACDGSDATQIANEILDTDDPPTAVFGTSDRLAHAVMQVAHDMGMRLPEDLSVMGFGDEPFAEFMMPALTSIRINLNQLGRACVQALLEKQQSDPGDWVREIKLDVQLVERSSTQRI
jgi:DNA-binding LacI/PurR family transcriptional regulator